MAKISGCNTVVQIATTVGGTYYDIAETNEVSRTFTLNNEDVSVFGDCWTARQTTIRDASYSMGGFTDLTDTNGQVIIMAAAITDQDLFLKVLFDGTNGYIQQVILESVEDSSSPSAMVTNSIEFAGNGTPTPTP
jgi:hypothetical protein